MSAETPRILVVDDEVDICTNLADILGDLGYTVDVAHEGETALELVRARPYDIALLDLKMPGMDGLTLYREIKALRAGTVAIIVSAYATSITAGDALDAGAWRVVAKPVDLTKLIGLVDEAAAQPLVLVVDDDRDLCTNLWQILRERSYRVYLAHDVEEAAANLRDHAFRVVLIDMKLPSQNGGTVFRLVRDADPAARTMLITGFRTETDALVAEVGEAGADAVCYKPFDIPGLLSTLRELSQRTRGPGGHEAV